jgi:hypothetical protein
MEQAEQVEQVEQRWAPRARQDERISEAGALALADALSRLELVYSRDTRPGVVPREPGSWVAILITDSDGAPSGQVLLSVREPVGAHYRTLSGPEGAAAARLWLKIREVRKVAGSADWMRLLGEEGGRP